MPELPDVEGFRRVLSDHAVGRRIRRVDVLDAGVIHNITGNGLHNVLRGHRFREPWRHGKHLVVPITGSDQSAAVLLHFGMTGSLLWATDRERRHRYDRVVFEFSDGNLCYRDMRKLHGLRFARDQHAVDQILSGLGPDAAELSLTQLREQLAGRRGAIKPTLMDQSVIAGLGNLMVDEILWRARIHPRRSCTALTAQDTAQIHARMRSVLRQAIPQGRVPPRKSWLTGRRDEAAGACPRCGTTLSHGRVGSRGTVWCPQCQPN